jgi:hypothetical protein
MFEPIEGLPDHVIDLRAVGHVTADDYKDVLVPAITRATEGGRKARLLLELGEGFEGYDGSAILADAEIGMGHMGDFEKVAVVTDADWIRNGVRMFGPMIPGEVRDFPVEGSAAAREWIAG